MSEASRHFLTILLSLTVGVLLRFLLLTHQSLWWDEGFSIQNSSASSIGEMFKDVRNIYHADKFQPFYYWLLFFARQLLGDSELVLRGLSAILGILTLPVIYGIARRFYGVRHAVWSLILAVFSAFLIYYSQEVRNYSLLILVSALQLYCLSEVILYGKKANSSYKWSHSILVGLGLFCSIQMAVFSASLSVSHFLMNKRWREWLAWWIPATVCVLPALIYYMTLPGNTNPGEVSVSKSSTALIVNLIFVMYGVLVGTTYGPSQDDLRGNNRLAVIFNHGSELLLLCIVCFGIVYFLWRTLSNRNQKPYFIRANLFFACLILSSLIFSILLAVITGMNLVPRHAFFLWVQIPILLPSIFCQPSLLKRSRHHLNSLARVFILAFISLNIYSASNYYFKEVHWRDDYRSVAQYLIEAQKTVDKTLLVSGEADILRYYGNEETVSVGGKWVKKLLSGNPDWVEGVQEKSLNDTDIVVAVYRPKRYLKTDISADLSNSYYILSGEEVKFHGFQILRLKAK